MKHPTLVIISLGALSLLLTSGCAVHTFRYQRQGPPHLRFTSKESARVFYEAVLGGHFPDGALDVVSFSVVKPFGKELRPTRSSILADAARRADTNQNGVISEAEAGSFATLTAKTYTKP